MFKGDKQITAARKIVALRQLPDEIANIMPNPPESLPQTKELKPSSDPAKLLGSKRRNPESLCTSSNPRAISNNPATGHLVYVRRKPDSEGCKLRSCASLDSASPTFRKPINGVAKENELQELDQRRVSPPSQEPEPPSAATLSPPSPVGSLPKSIEKPVRDFALTQLKDASVTAVATKPSHVQPKNLDCQNYWKDRFHQLQIFLEDCDQSNQEDYMQMLRSMSSVGRSKHAVELEKRAIQLLLEEGKELHRIKVMNVLGKALPNAHPPISSIQTVPSPLVEFPKIDEADGGYSAAASQE